MKENLNRHVDNFNELQHKHGSTLRMDSFFLSGSVSSDQVLLNRIHSQFESWNGECVEDACVFEGSNRVSEATYHLTQINYHVHALERRLEILYDKENPYSTPNLYFGQLPYTDRILMSPRWHQEFSMQRKFGDVCIDYATKGKSISHIALDNDILLLEGGGMPRAQITFNTGVTVFFSGRPKERISEQVFHRTHYEGMEILRQWIIDNQVEEKYGIELSTESLPGCMLLGTFVPSGPSLAWNSTVSQVLKYYSDTDHAMAFKIHKI